MIKEIINSTHSLTARILKSNTAQRFAVKYPASYGFLLNRFSVQRFTGLPLTILMAAILANLLLIMDFTPDVINSKEFIVIDKQVAEWLYSIRVKPLAEAFSWFTGLCNATVIIPLCSIAAAFFLYKKMYGYLKAILIALAGCGITIYLGKNIFQTDRPYLMAYHPDYSFSFPSGHTTAAVAVYGLFFYFMMRNTAIFKLRTLILITALAFALLIGFSRLYLCAHYLSDVLAGYMLGSIWLLLSISIFEWHQYSKNIRHNIPEQSYFNVQ